MLKRLTFDNLFFLMRVALVAAVVSILLMLSTRPRADESSTCIAVGETIPGYPIDYGRVPRERLIGIAAQRLIAMSGGPPEMVEVADEVIVFHHAATSALDAALNLRWLIVYSKGCFIAAGYIPQVNLDKLLPAS